MGVTATSTYYLTMRRQTIGAGPERLAVTPVAVDTARSELPPVASPATDSNAAIRGPQSKTPAHPRSMPVAAVRLVSTKPSAEQVYTSEIARLRVIVERRRSQLDPITISVIERNLQVIDDAIAQCKLALSKDPASRFLMESLNNALETKVELLRTATMLPSRSS
jgi:hypothetical protein